MGKKASGVFITFDGPNGVGKSTLIKAAMQNLIQQGLKVHLTKELSDTALGHFISKRHKQYRAKTLAFLLAADRQNHIETDIQPALRSYDIVLSDRYIASSLVYQRLDGVSLPFLWNINKNFLKPDLSLIVFAAPEIIVKRMRRRVTLDRFEEAFTRSQEVSYYKEAASFLEQKGFDILRFDNGRTSVKLGAQKLTRKIIGLIGQFPKLPKPS
jgi:dTMP kinase